MLSISVVMPTFNTDTEILKEAVDSILSQTFKDFEFIIIDDGSTDNSVLYLDSLTDERIRLIRNTTNLGITKSLNIGLRAAKGKYIARMDSDDIALPTRFEKQFLFMETHPDVIVCGTYAECFGAVSRVFRDTITDMEEYRVKSVFRNPGPIHPTVFINRELLQQYNIAYDENLIYAQDYGIWTEISRRGKIYVLEEILLRYRVHSLQISELHREKQDKCAMMVQKKLLTELLGNITDEELRLHYQYSTIVNHDIKATVEMRDWFQKLVEANDRAGIYDKKKFKHYIYDFIMTSRVYDSFTRDMLSLCCKRSSG